MPVMGSYGGEPADLLHMRLEVSLTHAAPTSS